MEPRRGSTRGTPATRCINATARSATACLGPRAPDLEKPPTDLTRLGEEKGEALRLDWLTRIIDGRRTLRAHGAGPMPVWGEKLAEDAPDWHTREEARIQLIQSLAEYILSIQRVEE